VEIEESGGGGGGGGKERRGGRGRDGTAEDRDIAGQRIVNAT
jgi:hypothetical protein